MVKPWLTFSENPPTPTHKRITLEEVRRHLTQTGVRTAAKDYSLTSALLIRLGLTWNKVRHVYAPTGENPGENDGIITVHGDPAKGDLWFSTANIEADIGVAI